MGWFGSEQIKRFIAKYTYAFLILLVGIFLMLVPTSSQNTPIVPQATEENASHEKLQDYLAEILSLMDGAGKVRVMLTTASSEKTIYQTDTTSAGEDTVILTDNNRNQLGLISQIQSPCYQGAIIVCQGADRPAVKLEITQAVSKVTGLSYDRITVLKMK